jgi:hypothetical protein
MSTYSPPKRKVRDRTNTPKLHHPAGYGHNVCLSPAERVSATSVAGMPKVHWPRPITTECPYHSEPRAEQTPPLDGEFLPQRKKQGGY